MRMSFQLGQVRRTLIGNLNANLYALLFFRCSFSEKFCQHLQEDLNPIIPSLRPRVHSSL